MEKELLIKDLAARLPYGVKCKGIYEESNIDDKIFVKKETEDILTEIHYTEKCSYVILGLTKECELDNIKPYLRPMSSMTEEEYKEYRKAGEGDTLDSAIALKQRAEGKRYISSWYRGTDWLLEHHFDFRGLVEKGLAIEAPEGMYNE